VVAHALPADTTVVRAGHDPDGMLLIVVRSASFDEVDVALGGRIPQLPDPQFQIVHGLSPADGD
jgi:hypothetical protein